MRFIDVSTWERAMHCQVFTIKVPDGVSMQKRACTLLHTDIGRASPYEQVGRQAGLRIWAAIAGARQRGAIDFYSW